MSDALYERYKDALRRGHVAALRGRQDAALAAYGEAAKLAPDRPLPLVGIGNVLAGIGKHTEAVAAFDAALERAPADEAALRGRADALVATGDRARAAETLDRLAAALDASGRTSDALDIARRALELAESRSRRAGVKAMVARLTQSGVGSDPSVSETLSRALGILEERVLGGGRHDAPGVADPGAAAPAEGPIGIETRQAAVQAAMETEAVPEPVAEAASEPEPPPPPPFDPTAAMAAVEDAAAAGDGSATRELALAAATGHRAAGQLHAAIDVCYLALATSPADPGLHLTLAELYLDLGWRATAVDKLVLLARLAELGGDRETRTRLCAVVTARLADEPALVSLCA
jgi:tetratricopeptide (TPR) repeat protein